MKKTYVSPAVAETTIETESLIANSTTFSLHNAENDPTVTASDALDGGRRGEWGNLWN